MLKFFDINSIRSRMVSGFIFLTFLILILAAISFHLFDRITRIAQMHSSISQLEIYTLSLIKYDNDFFDLETINENYFKTHESELLQRRDSLNDLISAKISWLIREERANEYGINKNILAIDSTLGLYNAKFKKLEALVFKRGFKDYGVEGAMRFHAHTLERASSKIGISNILYLRRHEKDFLLRNDTIYLSAFKRHSTQLLQALVLEPDKNKEAIHHLQHYQQCFIELAQLQKELGLTSEHGLRNELNNLTFSLTNQYFSLSDYSYNQSESSYHNIRILYATLISGAILFSLLSGYWISKRLSEPIARLSKIIHSASFSRNPMKTDLRIRNAANEINILAVSFIELMNQTKTQLEKIKLKSKLLRQKNRELKKINRELDNFLYSTAHDLRSPLSSLLGLINIIRYENKQDGLSTYFDMMEKNIHRSEEFISQIVSFSQNKKMEITAEKLDLHEIINNVFENHQFIEGASRIKKIVTLSGSVPFYSDRNRVTIIFNNLISNAIKYADWNKEEPFIKIVVSLREGEATIEFADNGIGIAKEHIHNIFGMFYRAHLNSKGSGLGLFIFKETIRRLNGLTTVESTEGLGTKYFIRLPNLGNQVVIQESLHFAASA